MWTQPRATIQQIVDRDPSHLVLLLAAVAGVFEGLNRASMKSLGDRMEVPYIVAAAVVGGLIGGIIGLYIAAALLRWTGQWIGGAASSETLRTAVAWSNVPAIWMGMLWIPQGVLFGKELFTSETPEMEASSFLTTLFYGIAFMEVIIGIWAFVILLKAVGQVQGFSAWKALGNMVLSALVVLVPLILIFTAVSLFFTKS